MLVDRRALMAAAVVITAPLLPGQEEVIQDDRPLVSRQEVDQDLTEDDFRTRESKDRGIPLELILGSLFLILVLVIPILRRDRRSP